MTDYKYPYGYTGSPQGMGQMLTWDQMMTHDTVRLMHPEVLRRFHAMIEYGASVGVPLGVGTGWRVQPNPPPPGFAAPGNSWHESCPCAPTSATALAIDTVPDVSWDWMEAVAGDYGLRTFRYVNNEPWHIQPYEIPAGRNYATVLPPLVNFQLPGHTPAPPEVDMTDEQAAQLKQIYTWLNHSASGWTPTAKMVNELRNVTISTVPNIASGELLSRIRRIEDRLNQLEGDDAS